MSSTAAAVLLGITLLAPLGSAPAHAAAASPSIAVSIDGQSVAFPAGHPYLQNGTVMVPFRAVFERLGLRIAWTPTTGTLTGKSADLTLSLKIGSKRATVNGTVSRLEVAPALIDGTVYVPLRFVGEATGGSVLWKSGRATIATMPPREQDTALAQNVVRQFVDALNAKNAAVLRGLTAEPLTQQLDSLEDTLTRYNLKTELASSDLLSLKGNEATVETEEKNVRTGGAYRPDTVDHSLYQLVRESGSWRISDITTLDSTVLLSREQGMTAATVPNGDQALINDTIKRHYQYLNAEDAAGAMTTLTSYGDDYDAYQKQGLTQAFEQYNLAYDLTASSIYYYHDNEAAVYIEDRVTDKDDGTDTQQRLILVLSRGDSGAWTIDESYTLPGSL